MEFKDRLRELRESHNLTTTQLAGAFEKSEGAIRMWESGRSKPDIDTLRKLADYFNVSSDYLIGRSLAQQCENSLVADDLRLTDKSIQAIKNMVEVPIHSMSKQHKDLPFDGRGMIDVLNATLCSAHFQNMLLDIGYLSDPTIDEWQNFSYIDDLGGEGYPAKTAYKQMAHERLDDLVAELRAKELNKDKR